MIKTFQTFLMITFLIALSGCDSKKEQEHETNKQEIKERQKDAYKHFKEVDMTFDTSYAKKRFYVPVYSHIYYAQNRFTRLAITLSIRNTDLEKDLYVENIDYYNTEGKLVKHYITKPHILKPMASVDYVVNLEDMSGGSGANFLIDIASEKDLTEPIIQAIMINNSGNSNLCFTAQGQIIK